MTAEVIHAGDTTRNEFRSTDGRRLWPNAGYAPRRFVEGLRQVASVGSILGPTGCNAPARWRCGSMRLRSAPIGVPNTKACQGSHRTGTCGRTASDNKTRPLIPRAGVHRRAAQGMSEQARCDGVTGLMSGNPAIGFDAKKDRARRWLSSRSSAPPRKLA